MNSILITGGSGFLGRHLAKELLKTYDRVCIYSRSEHTQADMRDQMNDSRLRWFIGDVRDKDRLTMAMRGCDSVIAAAALKRIEVGQYNPFEMVKTNILGTQNTIEAAALCGVKRFVFVSSDKATGGGVSPYGQTKALAESLVLNANHVYGESGPRFNVVRYGNIWGSSGSILPKWRQILQKSDTVPVTDPEATRFFMLIEEAVQLVIASLGDAPDISIPSLPAYSVGDLAEAMGAKMKVTGLPVWERKHEMMVEGESSDLAPRMSVDDLKNMLQFV